MENNKKPNFLTMLKYAPKVISFISKHWNEIMSAYVILKPIVMELIEEIKKEQEKEKQHGN